MTGRQCETQSDSQDFESERTRLEHFGLSATCARLESGSATPNQIRINSARAHFESTSRFEPFAVQPSPTPDLIRRRRTRFEPFGVPPRTPRPPSFVVLACAGSCSP